MTSYQPEWDTVPDVRDDIEAWEIDPHWLALQHSTTLPTSYMPTSSGGPQSHWRRVVAMVIIAMLVATVAAGICLTYGPSELFHYQSTR